MNLILKFLNTGTQPNQDIQTKKRIKTCNVLLFSGLIVFSIALLYHLYTSKFLLMIALSGLGIATFGSILWYQNQGKSTLTAHLLAISSIVLLSFSSLLIDEKSGINYHFLPLILFLFILFRERINKLRYGFTAAFIFIGLNIYHFFYQPWLNYNALELQVALVFNISLSATLLIIQIVSLLKIKHLYEQDLNDQNEIIEQKNMALTSAGQELRAIINNIHHIIVSVDRESKIQAFNDNFIEFTLSNFGCIPQTGALFNQYIFEENQEQINRCFESIISGSKNRISCEVEIQRFPGLYFEYNFNKISDREGVLTGIAIYIQDITEKKNWVKSLLQAEKRWQFALEGSRTGVWDWDLSTGKVYFSEQWKQTIGYEDHEIENVRSEWEKRVHPDDLKKAEKDFNNHLTGKTKFYVSEHRLKCKNGTYKWVKDSGKVIEWKDGRPVRMIGTQADIDLKKRAERDLKYKNQKLRELIVENQGMIGVVAHDLRSPLNKIKGLLNLVKMSTPVDDEQEKLFDLIDKVINTGLHHIKDLLDLQSDEARQLTLNFSEIEINKLFSSLITSYLDQAMKKDIQIHSNWERNMVIFSDSDRLTRIFDNLISNAIKFSPPKSNIYLNITRSDKHLQVSIKDEGPGFSDADKAKVFRKFQRLSAQPTAGESSSGLGLAIVKTFAEKLGGSVNLNSSPGHGAEFVISLPIVSRKKALKDLKSADVYKPGVSIS